jgi:hypothetical protein
MKSFYLLLSAACFLFYNTDGQTVYLSGNGASGTITLDYISDINGKPAYQGTGTVDGIAGTVVSVYWMDAPDLLWVVDFDGQPYLMNTCTTSGVPGTANTSCSWDAVPDQEDFGGAPLALTGYVVLPVHFISFTVEKRNGKAVLNWKTEEKANNKGFEVQRSTGGDSWNGIGFIPASGTTGEKSYLFTDPAPLPGSSYYQLIQVDLDGKKTYSPVAGVEFSEANGYLLGNSPGKGIYSLTIRTAGPVQVSVSDLSGQRILSRRITPGTHSLDISRYPSGVYILRLETQNKIITEKLIKQ